MVRQITVGSYLWCALAAAACAQIDLTPKESFYEVEGIRAPNVEMRNGPKKITYTPPAEWVLTGGAKKLTLAPKDSIQAGATITVEPSRESAPAATEANLKAYTEAALGLVPREASKVEVVEAVVSSLQISGKAMIDVTMSYSFFGQTFRMNVLFMPRDKEQMRFQFSARAADYPRLFKDFRSSLYSMQGL